MERWAVPSQGPQPLRREPVSAAVARVHIGGDNISGSKVHGKLVWQKPAHCSASQGSLWLGNKQFFQQPLCGCNAYKIPWLQFSSTKNGGYSVYIQWRSGGIKISEEEEEPLPPCFTSGPSPEYIFMLWFLLHAPLATLAFSPITDPASSFPSFTAPQLSAVCPFALSRRADGLCPFHFVFALVCHSLPQRARECHKVLGSFVLHWATTASSSKEQAAGFNFKLKHIAAYLGFAWSGWKRLVFPRKMPCFLGL